jgi:predicted GIY-YIG superfamily endonuclease
VGIHVLVATASLFAEAGLMGGWVYILTNRRNDTLYVGTTVDLARRVWEHPEGVADGFTKRYGVRRLSMPGTTQAFFRQGNVR